MKIFLSNIGFRNNFQKHLLVLTYMLILLLASVVLQSCDLGPTSSQAGPTPTLGPDDFSLCQYLGLAASASETGPIQTIPATPPIQSTAFTGKYPDIELIPLYPGVAVEEPDVYSVSPDGRILRLTADTDINSTLQFYRNALPKNGWVPTVDTLPLTSNKTLGVTGTFIWIDPANALPWSMTLEVGVYDAPNPKSTTDRTGILLLYKRFPTIGKGLAIYPTASNIKTTCSESFIMKFSVEDKSYQAAIQKSYLTTASPQEVTDYYSTALPTYGWRLQEDGTYYGTYTIAPSLIDMLSHLEVKIYSADGGGTKVDLIQSVDRMIEPHF